ncbi:hypothetical protein CNR33_00067 [Pseudomonas phage tabernarius]|uniref:Helicase C-terminal domain-containing protein n=1 Tax=Pseudomonas phage tabernarius TaxID=2048978 RepID=A0A2H4P6V1_9CAUD|nr:DNA helicase [Pseudomonas phage tabernarius]ATW57913.1 hypothetical protein CNR33_00067 [Pseudomonas phage tabernarius]
MDIFKNTTPVPGMKTGGLGHQIKGLELSAGKWNFAYLAEQGTGKTWMTIADIVRAYLKGRINAVLVLAPKGVHTNWVIREIPTHADIPVLMRVWQGNPSSKKARKRLDELYADHYEGQGPLRVFAVNIDAVNFAAGHDEVTRFLEAFPNCMMVVDESSRIKSPDAARTKKIVKLGRKAMARRILSGTPLTKNPADLFMQYQFLKPGLLGISSYRAFVAEFTVLIPSDDRRMVALMKKTGARVAPQLAETDPVTGLPMFKNLDRLISLISPHSYRITKEEALPFLPPKMYKRVYFELTTEQRKIYNLIRDDYEFARMTPDYTNEEYFSFEAIAARSKLKQVTSGFISLYGVPELLGIERNPRMQAFKSLVADLMDDDPSRSIIVWAEYQQEIEMAAQIIADMQIGCRIYNGKTHKNDREEIIDGFQRGDFPVFIGNPAAGGIGITLTRADTTIYLSTSENAELRLQSEDRNHRIGTVKTVVYYDLHAEDSVDDDVFKNVEHKKKLMDYVVNGVMRLRNERDEEGAELETQQVPEIPEYERLGVSPHNLTLESKQ